MPNKLNRPSIRRDASLPPLTSDEKDEALGACSVWLARNAQLEELMRRWQRLETALVRDPAWLEQSERRRRIDPKANELGALDERIAALHGQNQALASVLPKLVAGSGKGLLSKLAVVLIKVRAEENKAAHDLIRSIVRDLEKLIEAPE